MSTKPLFSPAEVQLEKVAFTAKLDEDASSWPSGILKEAYKQLPYLHKYEADIDLDRVDESRGYAVGKMLVYPARMRKHAASSEGKLVTFPVIVRDRELAPFDVYNHKESMFPEDEDSVNEVLFRPDAFGGSAPTGRFGDVDLQRQTTPPRGTNRYHGSMSKLSSVSLWQAALPTFASDDIEGFKSDLRDSAPLRNAFLTSEPLKAMVEDLVKHAGQNSWTAPPTVVQLSRSGTGYTVKVANHKAYAPTTSTINRFEAQDMLSDKHMQELLDVGHLTITIDPIVPEASIEKVAQEAVRAGVYTTYSGGKEVTGIVVPRMVSLSGEYQGIDAQVFFGESSHSIQEKVAGVFQRDLVIPGEEPRGPGSFVYQEGSMAYATEPVEILNRFDVTYDGEKIASYAGKSLHTGRPLTITIVPGLKKVAFTGSDDVAIPDTFNFVPLRGKQTAVSSTSDVATAFHQKKVASVSSVELVSDGAAYSIRGPRSSVFSGEIMDTLDTEFALSSLGLPKAQIQGAMKLASQRGIAAIPTVRRVVAMEDFLAQVENSKVDVSALRSDLTKEASVIVDKETVDAILSLRFVTPENVGVYVNYIPELEKVSSKLAELLVASRLGLDDVRETAAKNAMSQVSSVVKGLESLRAQTQ